MTGSTSSWKSRSFSRHLLAIVERRHGRARRPRDLLQQVRRLGDHEVVDVDDAREAPLGVDDEELAQILRLALPQLLERHGRGLLAAEARDPRVHDAAGRARRIIHEPPHLGFGAPRQQREAAVARFFGDPRQRDREHAGIEHVQRLLQAASRAAPARPRRCAPARGAARRSRACRPGGRRAARTAAARPKPSMTSAACAGCSSRNCRLTRSSASVASGVVHRPQRRRSVPIRSPMLRHTLPAPIAMSSVTSAISRSPFGPATRLT